MKSRRILIALSCLAGAIVLIKVATVLFLQTALPRSIRELCEEKGWSLESVEVKADLWGSGLQVSNLAIRARDGVQPFSLRLASLRMEGIHPFTLWFRDRFVVREITVEKLKLSFTSSLQRDSVPWSLPVPIRVQTLSFRALDVQLLDTVGSRAAHVQDGNVVFHNLQFREQEAIVCKALEGVQLSATSIEFVSQDSMYTYSASGLLYDASKQFLSTDSIRILPNYPDYEFTSRLKFQADCIQGTFRKVACSGLPAGECLATGSIRTRFVEVGNMQLDIFRDRRKPDPHLPMPMLQEVLYDFPMRLVIDSVVLHDGKIAYTEHVKVTDRVATVRFSGIAATCSGITNDTNSTHKELYLLTDAMLLGKSPLHCQIRGRLFDPQHNLHINGSLGSIDGSAFNPILENSSPVQIKSGVLDKLRFSFDLNKQQSAGKMTLLYHDLDIGLNKESKVDPLALVQAFIMFLGTGKTLESNPMKGKSVRQGEIGIPRDKEKSIFNYCLQSLLSGSESTMNKRQARKIDSDSKK